MGWLEAGNTQRYKQEAQALARGRAAGVSAQYALPHLPRHFLLPPSSHRAAFSSSALPHSTACKQAPAHLWRHALALGPAGRHRQLAAAHQIDEHLLALLVGCLHHKAARVQADCEMRTRVRCLVRNSQVGAGQPAAAAAAVAVALAAAAKAGAAPAGTELNAGYRINKRQPQRQAHPGSGNTSRRSAAGGGAPASCCCTDFSRSCMQSRRAFVNSAGDEASEQQLTGGGASSGEPATHLLLRLGVGLAALFQSC